jgi:lantibiotic modifying enzyme
MVSHPQSDIIYPETRYVLSKQIDDIAHQILSKKKELINYNLLDGKAGITLLYAYLAKLSSAKKYLPIVFDLLNELRDSLSNDELDHHLSSGVAGIAFTFQHLRNIGVLDRSVDLNLSEMDEFLNLGIDDDFTTDKWDPLHGMVGLGVYFLERNKETGEKKYLEKIVDRLALMRTAAGEYKIWITRGYGKYSNDNYNFGMAHGMPGILSFLAQVHSRGIRSFRIEEMISTCMPFLLQHEYIDDTVYCFPTSIDVELKKEEKPLSRHAWCYGDLCMANALIHCGKALRRGDWMNKGIETALKTTRRPFENSGVVDAPFCHGSVGLVHQYNRLYQLTGNEIFKNAARNWLNITREKFHKPGEGAGGYYFLSHNEEKACREPVAQYGLLEGCAGIALVYLSWIFNIQSHWDIIFLTNV